MSEKKARKTRQDELLFVSVCLSGKMEGVTGITTSCTNVDFCQKMREFAKEHPEEADEYICSHCYAEKSSRRSWKCWDSYENNTKLLTEHIKRSKLPNLRFRNSGTNFARFNSHGEVPNEECVANFYRIASRNPSFRFALWTKRWYFLVNLAKAGMKPPKNLCIVLSSPRLGEDVDPEIIRTCEEAGVHVDTVFTVYRKEDAEARGIEINCGDRKCAQCRKCYTHHSKNIIHQGGTEMIKSMERMMVDLDKRCESCRDGKVDCTYCEHYESCTKKHEYIGELLASDEGFTMEEAEREFINEKMCSRCPMFDCMCYFDCLYEE